MEASPNNVTKLHSAEWWADEDGLFNVDEEGRAEKQQCAVVASNVIRNFSFMPENEVIMAQHRHCLETVFQCIEDYVKGVYKYEYRLKRIFISLVQSVSGI